MEASDSYTAQSLLEKEEVDEIAIFEALSKVLPTP
jgi:hypothetical protein